MGNKLKSVPSEVDLTKAAELVRPRAQDEIVYKRQRLMDLGYMDHDTGFELPDGASPLLYDVRFENGGVRKDFGLTARGTPAPARVADMAHYAYVDPITHVQVNRIARIYRNPANGLATIDFWDGADWSGAVQGEEMEDTLVKATVIQGILAFADGKRIHFYEEAETDILVAKQDFLDQFTGLPVTEGLTDDDGSYQYVPITEEPLGDRITLNWRVENFTGVGKIIVRFYVPTAGPGDATLFERTYNVNGAASWPSESETIKSGFPGLFNEIRMEVRSVTNFFTELLQQLFPVILGLIAVGMEDPSSIPIVLPMLGFISALLGLPKFAVQGYAEENGDEAPGALYQYMTAPVTSFRTEGPPADYVFSFEDRLIALGGFDNPERIAGSADGNPRLWDELSPDLGVTGAFEYAILDSVSEPVEDMVAGGKVADNIAAILRRRSILRAEETGVAVVPLKVSDWKDGIGTESPKSLTQVPDGICFLGHDLMAYYFTGEREPIPIGQHVWQTFIEDIQPASLPFVEGQYDETLSEWWLGIPEDGGAGITGFWIFDLGRFRSRGEQVWRYKPALGIAECLPIAVAPPPVGEPPPEEPPEIPPPPPPPPETTVIEVVGVPFEIIEVATTGMVWIGFILSYTLGANGTDLLIRVYDPLTTDKIQELTFPTHLAGPIDGWAMCYHPTREEVWLYASDTAGGTGNYEIVVIDAVTYQQKANYHYTGIVGHAGGENAIEFCPANGLIYATLQQTLTGDRIAEIDPADGTILRFFDNSGVTKFLGNPDPSFDQIYDSGLVWDEAREVFIVSSVAHLFFWEFDPVSGAVTERSGNIAVHNGNFPEKQLAHIGGYNFYVFDRRTSIFRWLGATPANISGSVWKSLSAISTLNPGAAFIGPIDSEAFRGVAASRGIDSSVLPQWQDYDHGVVTVWNMNGDVLRQLVTGVPCGRLVYAPRGENIVTFGLYNLVLDQRETGVPIFFLSVAGIHNVPDVPPDVPRGNPEDPKTDPAPTPEPEPEPPAGEPIEITAIRPYCTSTITEDAPPGSGLYSGTVVSGFEVEFTPDPDPNINIRAVPVGADPTKVVDSASGSTKLAPGHWRTPMFTETVVSQPIERTPFCPGGPNQSGRDVVDTFWDVYVEDTSTNDLSNKATVRVHNPKPIFDEGEEPDPPIDPITLNPPTPSFSGGLVWQNLCTRNEEAGSTSTNWTGTVTISGRTAFHHGNDNPLGIPIMIAEFNAGADPNVDTPLRTVIKTGGTLITVTHQFTIWQYALQNSPFEPHCAQPVLTLTRRYAARHVLGDGKFGPWSATRDITYEKPAP